MMDIGLAGLLLGTVILLTLTLGYRRRSRLPPGPRGFLLLGNSHQIDPRTPHVQLTEWTKRYGDIYTVRLLGQNVVVLSSSELIRHAAVSNSEAFAGRPVTVQRRLQHAAGFNLSYHDMTDHWMRIKKVVVNALKMYGEGLARLEEMTLEVLQETFKAFDSREGKVFDPKEDLQRLMTVIMFNLTFGRTLSQEEADEVIQLEETTLSMVCPLSQGLQLDTAHWMRFSDKKPTVNSKQPHKVQDDVAKIFHPAIKTRKKMFDGDNIECVADALLKHNLFSNMECYLNDVDVCATLRDLNEAAVTPCVMTLYNLLGLSATHLECQQHMHAAIDKVMGSGPPQLAHRKKMPYVEATILECLRLTSHYPLALPHKTTRNVDMNGYVIPEGVQVILNLWSLHHDERYWDDPHHFIPERFLTHEGKLISMEHPNRRRLLAFGSGRRGCVGETVTKNRLFLLLTAILQRYTLLPGDKKVLPHLEPHDYIEAGAGIGPGHLKIRAVLRKTITHNADQ